MTGLIASEKRMLAQREREKCTKKSARESCSDSFLPLEGISDWMGAGAFIGMRVGRRGDVDFHADVAHELSNEGRKAGGTRRR